MKNKTVYALGFFDGVHLGHEALLAACRNLVQERDCQTGVVTFDSHPDTLVLGQTPGLINTPEDRVLLLKDRGIQRVVSLPFDKKMMTMDWRDFFHLLVNTYGAAGIVCGDDFRFGYKGQGNPQLLCQACEEMGIPFRAVPQQYLDGVRISSTYIRQLLQQGQMEQAVRFLGHPHILSGTVMPGQQIGRTIGIPTANLSLPPELLIPKFGVYACKVQVGEKTYCAVTNIGTRPTISGRGVTVEPWLLDFQGQLYGQKLTLEFHKFLRPEEKFPNLEALQREIQKNAAETRKFFGKQ